LVENTIAMSMIGKLRRITAGEMERVRTDENFLLAATGMGSADGQFPWLLRMLLRLTGTAVAQPEPLPKVRAPQGEILTLDKSWHGLHYLIAGDPWEGTPPLRHAVLGETEIGDDLAGYGPAKVNGPEQVREVAEALAALSGAELMRQYDGLKMEELKIYPGGWASDGTWKKDLGRDLGRLREFYKRAAAAGDATISWIE
jgi:hypothetical protein